MKKHFTIVTIAFLAFGCTNDSTSDLINDQPVETVTYIENVRTIIDNNCIVCHGNVLTGGAPMSLTTYTQVKDAILNQGLLDRISRGQGAPGMMPNGGMRLPQNQIDLVEQWAEQGLQE